MPIRIDEPCTIDWHVLMNWGMARFPHWLPVSAYYFEAGRKYKVNPILLACWASVRSEGFTSKNYNDNLDIFNLGGLYKSYGDSLACGAAELAKMADTSMLQEQDEVEKLYADFYAYANKAPTPVEPPKPPEPSKPVPVPVPKEPDTPEVPAEPKKPTNWKMILGVVSGILAAAALVTRFIPGVVDDAVVSVLKMLVDALQQAF